ncbi:glycosyltransferase family 39 protein [Candidatus Woesearchaeota archaeon]|nr:glycosyltransferase family 39 protein [Candidatus Woesearchaeota archaeon]
MKISLKKIEILLIAVLYLAALYIWTLPIQKNMLPFGDVDSSSHFTIGDYMVSYDRSILEIPYPVTFRYYGQNNLFPALLWYPPQYWTNLGIMQVIGGERILPVFILVAVFCTLIIISSYFLIRSLFGFWAAFLSSFLLVFSARDFMIYLWGQWPQSLSFAFTPLILYCFYQYNKHYNENQNRQIYLYMLALFLAAQFFFHPQGMVASAGALIAYCIFLAIKKRKLPFNIKHALIPIVLFVLVSSAFAPLNVGEFVQELASKQQSSSGESKGFQLDKLFKWYHGIKNDPGLPDFYFTYNQTHGSLQNILLSWWTLPFLLIGLFVLAYRRNDEDLLLLGWFASFYFLTRLTVFGYGARDIRMFAYEAHIFYPIIAIGVLSLSSLAKQNALKKYLKYALIMVFLALAVSINGKSAYDVLKSQQYSIARINNAQYESAEWIRINLPENADIYDFGTFGYQNYAAKIKWLMALSQRHFIISGSELNMTDYIFIDYTDALALRSQNYLGMVQNFESNLQNQTPIYNKNNIKVYKVAGIKI